MEQYLIDTNIVCDYFSASLPVSGMTIMDTAIDASPNLSVITQIELLCWKTNPDLEQTIKNFIIDSAIMEITSEVIAHCVDLRKNKKIKTPDAIIAATALAYGFTFVTNNEKDFKNIDGLKIVNPHQP
jgi:predicted nucleic acid-binding protein